MVSAPPSVPLALAEQMHTWYWNMKSSAPVRNSTPAKPASLAITGMAAHFGECASLDELRQALYAGRQLFTSLPPQRWKGLEDQAELLRQYGIDSIPQGAYLSSFEMDFLYFKIPPNDADQPIPQQLLMLKVADAALQDAKMKPGGNVAVLIAMDTELALHEFRGRVDLTWQLPAALERAGVTLTPEQAAVLQDRAKDSLHIPALVNQYTSFIGNIMASRIAALWDFSGPAFTLSAAENSIGKALEVAQMLLSNGEVEAVVVGAVDLAGGIEHVLIRQQMSPMHDHSTQPTLGFDQHSSGWLIGEGAGAVVLQRADQSTHSYATLEALACGPATAEGVASAARTALQNAGVEPKDVGYIEVSAGGFPYQDDVEMRGLSEVYEASAWRHGQRQSEHRPYLCGCRTCEHHPCDPVFVRTVFPRHSRLGCAQATTSFYDSGTVPALACRAAHCRGQRLEPRSHLQPFHPACR